MIRNHLDTEKMAKVSFDFDKTLSKNAVQVYAKSLVKQGHEVWITTARYEDGHELIRNHTNSRLYQIAKKVGISRDKIVFTNMEGKWQFLKDQGFTWHIDDDPFELKSIWLSTEVIAIDVMSSTWMAQCERALNTKT